ncbi:MAG: aminotransferase class I/II-fold pyridoxal phosphate-dependent enzyme [Lishizhenia sp.]
MENLSALLSSKLKKRAEKSALRSLSLNNYTTDFYSNDYLGISKLSFTNTCTTHSGTGSRLISGTSKLSLDTEYFLAEKWNSEAALIFNSGYDANIGLLSTIADRNTTILYDEHIHASARDGIVLSKSKAIKFRHNNFEHLRELLQKTKGVCIVLVESIYSMHGDFCDLKKCVELCTAFGASLIVDEAHAGGVFGEFGGGRTQELGLENQVFARLITFGKGLGAHGACILGSQVLIDSLINFARSFIYTTALPESAYIRIKDVVSNVNFIPLQNQLYENIVLFNEKSKLNISPIQIWEPKHLEDLKKKELSITQENIGIKAIYAPTVKESQERLRICIHAFNSKEEILSLKQLLL